MEMLAGLFGRRRARTEEISEMEPPKKRFQPFRGLFGWRGGQQQQQGQPGFARIASVLQTSGPGMIEHQAVRGAEPHQRATRLSEPRSTPNQVILDSQDMQRGSPREQVYKTGRFSSVLVKEGDTLSAIALKHRIPIGELQRLNNIRSHLIYPGDQILLYETEVRGAKAELAKSRAERGASMRRTYRPLFRRANQIGGPDMTATVSNTMVEATLHEREVARWNGGSGRPTGNKAPKPRGAMEVKACVYKGWRGKEPIKHRFDSPVPRAYLSSTYGMRWGKMHEGVDLAAATGTAIRAAAQGVVSFIGWDSGYGNFLELEHDFIPGWTTRYAHCDVIKKKIGDRVNKGEWIADVGETGRATGPHLHFEVRKDEKSVDPSTIVRL